MHDSRRLTLIRSTKPREVKSGFNRWHSLAGSAAYPSSPRFSVYVRHGILNNCFNAKTAATTNLLLLAYSGLGGLLLAASGFPGVEWAWTAEFAAGSTIDDCTPDIWSVVAADIDSDGDSDIVAALYTGSKVLWYENLDSMGTFPEEGDEISDLAQATCKSLYSAWWAEMAGVLQSCEPPAAA